MFPIIPYNFNMSRSSVCFENNLMARNKVIASCDIAQDIVSAPIDPRLLSLKLDKADSQTEIGLNEKGHLSITADKKSLNNFHWVQLIRLADDCHSYNARLCLEKSTNDDLRSNIIVQITRPIKAGHELLLWFSEDVLAIFQMAFLTPANIQGQKRYVCNSCSEAFEFPNPLKLHMTLECGKHRISYLWERLYASLTTENFILNPKNTLSFLNSPFGFELGTKDNGKSLNNKYSVLNLSRSNTDILKSNLIESKLHFMPKLSPTLSIRSTITKSPISTSSSPIPRPYSEPLHSSAFKPYSTKKNCLNFVQNNNPIHLSQSINNFTNLSLNNSEPNLLIPNGSLQNYPRMVDFRHAAHMESLVSNLGKSKQGHLCIYCGKCYSRKYGLKIHIRTHTGYKPLKCKYCLRPFGDPSNLNKHVRLHAEGDTPYKCELCGKVLVRRRDLERHLKSRHVEEMQLGQKVEDTSSSSDHSDD